EAYQMINEYVAELYHLPEKLVEDAGQTLESMCCEKSKPLSDLKMHRSCQVVIDFMDQLDDFTVHTIKLFGQHKKHVEATRVYIRRVSALKTKHKGSNSVKELEDYNKLMPELDNLLNGLKLIKESADNMIARLDKLDLRWQTIKVKVA
ncbi:MAG: hypothetical protein V4615_03765, partial [Bacteroidota bacterium]